MATNTSEDIIEKRDSSPLATSCLVLATLAILGAITLQLLELRQVRAGMTQAEQNQHKVLTPASDLKKLERRVESIITDGKIGADETEKLEAILTGDDDDDDVDADMDADDDDDADMDADDDDDDTDFADDDDDDTDFADDDDDDDTDFADDDDDDSDLDDDDDDFDDDDESELDDDV